MPASLTRNEYYWEQDRMVCRTNHRSSIYSQWGLKGNQSDLVVAIEDLRDSQKMTEGGAASQSRFAQAILREHRLSADPNANDIGASIPEALISRATEAVKLAVGEVTRQFKLLSNEERRTGAVAYELNRQQTIEHDGWELTMFLQGFSTQNKEPIIGADIGLVVDLKRGDLQVSKGVLIQAKEATSVPDEPLKLDRLNEQMTAMLKRTKESYGMIYTPNGIFVFQGRNSKKMTELDSLITEIARCRHGDRRPELLAEAIEEEYTFELAFQDLNVPGATKAARFKREQL